MKQFTIYTLGPFKAKDQRISKLTGTENTADEELLPAIRQCGVRFQDNLGLLLSDGQVLALVLKERGDE